MPQCSNSAEQEVELDPQTIYFTFSRIRPSFSCGRPIETTLQQFIAGEIQPRDLPLLSVFIDGKGNYYSQNNRRLYMYKKLKEMGYLLTVPVRLRPLPTTRRMKEKYSPTKCSLTAVTMGKEDDDKTRSGNVEISSKFNEESDDESALPGSRECDTKRASCKIYRATEREENRDKEKTSTEDHCLEDAACGKEEGIEKKEKKKKKKKEKHSHPFGKPQLISSVEDELRQLGYLQE